MKETGGRELEKLWEMPGLRQAVSDHERGRPVLERANATCQTVFAERNNDKALVLVGGEAQLTAHELEEVHTVATLVVGNNGQTSFLDLEQRAGIDCANSIEDNRGERFGENDSQ